MEVQGQTRLLAVIGDPIAHSLSPRLHNALCRMLHLDYRYLAFRVAPVDLEAAVAGLRSLGAAGFNVTVPHKEAILPLLDGLSPEAEALGAVNTVVPRDGRLIGDNTDWLGFLAPLEARGVPLAGCRVVVLGAGGVARAAVYALVRRGAARITLANRQPRRAKALAAHAAEALGFDGVAVLPLEDLPALRAALGEAELLVNATPVGMWPRVEQTPLPARALRAELLVYDLVYNPLETRLLREARRAGASAIEGLDMLIGQGVEALRRWTGRAPSAAQRTALRERLAGALWPKPGQAG